MNPFDAAMMPSEIVLGYLDENHWRPQPFDCSSFLKEHPDGIMTLWVQPHGAARAFPVALERDGNIFTWTPLDEEITAAQGKLQLMCVDGTDNGRSAVSYWRVGESIVPGAAHPADVPSWAAETIRRAEDAARRAEKAAEDIEIDPELVAQVVADYLDTHPVEGEPGASAYELAVEQGYTGTLEEWLASLHGRDGTNGKDGADGKDGTNGIDGVSPAVSVSAVTGGHAVTITDKDHPNGQTFNVMDGKDGKDGQDGQDGDPGPQGPAGQDGSDYVLTIADKQEIAQQAAQLVDALPDTTSASAGDFLRLDAQKNAAWETISSVMGASIPLGD